MTAQIAAQAPDVDAERLNRPLASRLATWYTGQVRKVPDRQAAEAAAQGAQEKLIEAGAERAAAEQIVASLAEAVAKKAPGTSPGGARNAR